MSKIVNEIKCDSLALSTNPELWTAVIPAAGKGSRLGYDLPKLLYPLLGRTIMDWVLDALRPVCSRYVFVASPSGRESIEKEVKKRLGDAAQVIVQESPTGMGDAVLCAKSAVHTLNTLVVWGDQITLSQNTVSRCAGLHEKRKQALLTLPTILKLQPYIHIVRDSTGRIIEVQQAREQTIAQDIGESDCGLFMFSSDALFSVLDYAGKNNIGFGLKTKEFNLLQVIPQFEISSNAVETLRISDINETLGVNTLEDAKLAESILRKRSFT